MLDKSINDFLDTCFPSVNSLPSGSEVFSTVKDDAFVVELRGLSRSFHKNLNSKYGGDIPLCFSKSLRESVPGIKRKIFLEWLISVYLSHPHIYEFLYDQRRPLSETHRIMENIDLSSLISGVGISEPSNG
jgi:hypothetical protein